MCIRDSIGLAPKAGAGETTNPELAAQAAQQQAGDKLLPDAPWNLAKLRAMDADVRLRAKRIETRALPVDDMDATLALKDGVLVLKPLDFGVADGTIRSTIRMDARERAIRSNADIRATGLVLSKLMPDSVKLGQTAVGKVGGRVVFSSQGNSIAQLAATADGAPEAGMGAGRISKLLMEFAGLDLAEMCIRDRGSTAGPHFSPAAAAGHLLYPRQRISAHGQTDQARRSP